MYNKYIEAPFTDTFSCEIMHALLSRLFLVLQLSVRITLYAISCQNANQPNVHMHKANSTKL